MKLTAKGRYAVTAVLDVAIHGTNEPVSLSDIANRQHLSLSYLEQLFNRLRRKGIVISIRGASGGYQLGNALDDISVGMIISAVDEDIIVTKCLGKGNCKNGKQCLTHSLWDALSQQIQDFLNNITLADLVDRYYQTHAINRENVNNKSELSAILNQL